MDIIRQKWDTILETVRNEHELTDISFKTWLEPLTVYDVDEENHLVRILVPSEQMGMGLGYIKKKYLYPIKVAIAEITGTEYEIDFVLPDEVDPADHSSDTKEQESITRAKESANLDSKYTFDTFVVGSNNKFAHAASLAVAESPGKMYNPLFIYGGSGLGKTHLMHSIAHFILEKDPSKKVLYVTSEAFTNELIALIRNKNDNQMSSFREKYRNVDVLLIDDIQFIIGKDATQLEFFHTFNDLHGKGKQIILSSDKPPKEMETLESRLRSRFEWGILADIGSPDYETRMAILTRKQEEEGYNIDAKILDYIASNITSNIRELEGALNKLLALSNLEEREISLELAEEALKDIISPDQERVITLERIVDIVADHFKIDSSDILSSNRSSRIVIPRQIVMYLCRYNVDLSLQEIGMKLGRKDHSTVIHGVNKIENELQTSQSMRNTIDILKKKIISG